MVYIMFHISAERVRQPRPHYNKIKLLISSRSFFFLNDTATTEIYPFPLHDALPILAREILANNHWIIPLLNGVSYLEKPPMLYWLIALSYKIFGINAFGARFVPSLATALTAVS